MMNAKPLDRAIAVAGSRYRLAKLIGVKPPSVYDWDEAPADRCIAIEAATGVSRYHLRPDVFGEVPDCPSQPPPPPRQGAA